MALSTHQRAGAYYNGTDNLGEAGLEIDYALIDFARTPLVQAARANLEQQRNRYGNQLRRLQLDVSEAYYGLQRADQNVRIQDAAVQNDLVILQDTLDMQIAGLVPRLDVMRRRAIEASDQEVLIQAMADRAIARRRLAVVLNLNPEITPSASDPIVPMPDWPLDLEASLLAAYRGNPELEAILAAREALAKRSDAVAAQLLPKLSLFGNAGTYGINEQMYNVIPKNGGCCGTAINTVSNNSGYDWALGLSLQWLLFDAGTTSGQAGHLIGWQPLVPRTMPPCATPFDSGLKALFSTMRRAWRNWPRRGGALPPPSRRFAMCGCAIKPASPVSWIYRSPKSA